MYDIREIKIGDIMVCDCGSSRQFFYVHNIYLEESRLEMSGISKSGVYTIYPKTRLWIVDRRADIEETMQFYALIERGGFKFNVNTGVTR